MRVDHHKTAANSCACRKTRSKVTAYLTKRLSLQKQSSFSHLDEVYVFLGVHTFHLARAPRKRTEAINHAYS